MVSIHEMTDCRSKLNNKLLHILVERELITSDVVVALTVITATSRKTHQILRSEMRGVKPTSRSSLTRLEVSWGLRWVLPAGLRSSD